MKKYISEKKLHEINKYEFEAEAYLEYFTKEEPNILQQERIKGILEAIEYIKYIIEKK